MRIFKFLSDKFVNIVYGFFALDQEVVVSETNPEVQVARKPSYGLQTGIVRAFGEHNLHSNTFTVHAGSEISKKSLNPNFPHYKLSGQTFRELASYVPSDNNKNVVLIKDYTFASPSMAATICIGNSTNGLDAWVHMTEDKSLKDVVTAERALGL